MGASGNLDRLSISIDNAGGAAGWPPADGLYLVAFLTLIGPIWFRFETRAGTGGTIQASRHPLFIKSQADLPRNFFYAGPSKKSGRTL
jgi:hypothetical protein